MDRKSRLRIAIGSFIATAALVALPGAAPAGTTSFCSDGASPPCVLTATRNGSTVTAADPDWGIYVTTYPGNSVYWVITNKNSKGYDLGSAALSDNWVIIIDMGTRVPRVAFTHGTQASFVRFDDGDGTHRVRIAARPTRIVGECNQSVWPWTCPHVPTQVWEAYLDGEVTPYNAWETCRKGTRCTA